jgi:hypothetical protein
MSFPQWFSGTRPFAVFACAADLRLDLDGEVLQSFGHASNFANCEAAISKRDGVSRLAHECRR